MSRAEAMELACERAHKTGVTMAVVHDPIANAEDSTGPYAYCPLRAVHTLFRHGTVIAQIGLRVALVAEMAREMAMSQEGGAL